MSDLHGELLDRAVPADNGPAVSSAEKDSPSEVASPIMTSPKREKPAPSNGPDRSVKAVPSRDRRSKAASSHESGRSKGSHESDPVSERFGLDDEPGEWQYPPMNTMMSTPQFKPCSKTAAVMMYPGPIDLFNLIEPAPTAFDASQLQTRRKGNWLSDDGPAADACSPGEAEEEVRVTKLQVQGRSPEVVLTESSDAVGNSKNGTIIGKKQRQNETKSGDATASSAKQAPNVESATPAPKARAKAKSGEAKSKASSVAKKDLGKDDQPKKGSSESVGTDSKAPSEAPPADAASTSYAPSEAPSETKTERSSLSKGGKAKAKGAGKAKAAGKAGAKSSGGEKAAGTAPAKAAAKGGADAGKAAAKEGKAAGKDSGNAKAKGGAKSAPAGKAATKASADGAKGADAKAKAKPAKVVPGKPPGKKK
eukprot:Selendium_serpulae@DN5832_c0_g1_i1.p1